MADAVYPWERPIATIEVISNKPFWETRSRYAARGGAINHNVVKAPKSSHITPILRSLHWLKSNERIEYKLLSLTYKVLTTSQPDYLHNLISSVHRQNSLLISCHPSWTIRIFLITNHQPLFHICITLPVESASFFIPSTSFCSLSSWFTSSCAYHLITVTTFALITYHCLYISLQT